MCSKLSAFEHACSTLIEGTLSKALCWTVFVLVVAKKAGDVKKPRLRIIKFRSTDASKAQEAVEGITDGLYPSRRNKKLLFILNPVGGTRKAMKRYNAVVLPMLQMAGLEESHELRETQFSGHASKIAAELDVAQYLCAVAISGDGVFHELVNGLLTRSDWQTAHQLPIGMVGSGTSNAFSKNLDLVYPELAVLAAFKTHSRWMDALSVTQGKQRVFSHLMLAWGFIADIDIESEAFRFMGETRMIITALARLVNFRNYRGRIYMLPSEQAELFQQTQASPSNCGPPCRYLPTDSKDYFTAWPLQVDGYMQMFIASNLPWISSEFLALPKTQMDDGKLGIVWSEKMARSEVLAVLLDQEHGIHMTFNSMHHAQVNAFVLEPEGWVYRIPKEGSLRVGGSDEELPVTSAIRNGGTSKGGILDLSGERIAYAPVHVEVHPKAIHVIVPIWLDDKRWKTRFDAKYGRMVN